MNPRLCCLAIFFILGNVIVALLPQELYQENVWAKIWGVAIRNESANVWIAATILVLDICLHISNRNLRLVSRWQLSRQGGPNILILMSSIGHRDFLERLSGSSITA